MIQTIPRNAPTVLRTLRRMSNMSSRYLHKCTRCIFLGQKDEYDLYFCDQDWELPTIVARYSDDSPDYLSGMVAASEPPYTSILRTGYKLAVARGLID